MATYNFNEVPSQLQKPAQLEMKLENDGDSMLVRFLLDENQSFMGESVHNVYHKGWYQTISCNQEAGQTKDDCPLCSVGCPARECYCLPIFVISKTTNYGNQTVDVNGSYYLKRGKTFRPLMESILRQCDGKAPVNTVFRILRNGAAKATNTTYVIEKVSTDCSTKLSDFPELPPALGTNLVQKLTNTEMLAYCDSWKIQVQNEEAKKANRATNVSYPQVNYQPNFPQQPAYQPPQSNYQPNYQQPPAYQPPYMQGAQPNEPHNGFGSSPNIGL